MERRVDEPYTPYTVVICSPRAMTPGEHLDGTVVDHHSRWRSIQGRVVRPATRQEYLDFWQETFHVATRPEYDPAHFYHVQVD